MIPGEPAVWQAFAAALYLAGGILLVSRERWGVGMALAGAGLHASLLFSRWVEFGRLPIVTRHENISVDALTAVVVYLVAQWRIPALRRSGLFVLPMAAIGTLAALLYNPQSFPWTPALRTNWLVIHASLNSLAVAGGALAAGAILVPSGVSAVLKGRLLAWTFFWWCAMIAAGSYWASLAWGRYWGWDPIESWALATALAYAFVLHLGLLPAWKGMTSRFLFGILPFGMMLFTTYGLLMVRNSIHGQYLFQ